MPNHEEFMAESRRDLSKEKEEHQPVSPPATAMRYGNQEEELPAPKKQKLPCRRTHHTPWRGSTRRR